MVAGSVLPDNRDGAAGPGARQGKVDRGIDTHEVEHHLGPHAAGEVAQLAACDVFVMWGVVRRKRC